MNYSSLGNVVEHIHFHIFPRYEDELLAAEEKHPWFHIDKFNSKRLSSDRARDLATKIREELQSFLV